jgi:hypothetical protein
MSQSYRQSSRGEWFPADGRATDREDIKTGCLQRIADATEKMAQSHADLIASRDRYKRWYEDKSAECEQLARTIAGLRGTITRMRREQDGAR